MHGFITLSDVMSYDKTCSNYIFFLQDLVCEDIVQKVKMKVNVFAALIPVMLTGPVVQGYVTPVHHLLKVQGHWHQLTEAVSPGSASTCLIT